LGALLASGYIGRTIRAIERFNDQLIADAGFGIAEVRISGNSRTPPETIAAALGLAPGQSIFGADLGAARARLMALDWVADADVRRRYPDAITVHLVEKLPYALWKSPNGLYVVERSGGVITNKNLEPFAHLPVLVGAGANVNGAEIVDQVAQHRAVTARVRAIERVSDRRWNLLLDDGVVVKLPEVGWQKELDTLDHLIIDKGVLERDISEIDLRSPERFFFVLRNGEQKEEPRGRQI
jgi:cell division protein FtsQ